MDKDKLMDTVKTYIAEHLNCSEEDLQKDGEIIALAGASKESETMWEIGVGWKLCI